MKNTLTYLDLSTFILIARNSRVKSIIAVLSLLFFLPVSANTLAATLTSIVDRSEIGIDETLELTVRYTGNQSHGSPDFSELRKQFEVLSTNQSNQFRSVNGQVTSFTDWQMVLAPKKEGIALIPSFRFSNTISDAVQIKVNPAAKLPAGKLGDVYLETEINKTEAYVQEQIIVTYRLFYSVRVDSLNTDPLEPPSVIKEQLPDKRYRRRINDKVYDIAEFSFALFPETSETLEIPSLNWNVRIAKGNSRQSLFGLSGRYEIKRLRTKAFTVNVKPRPDSFPAGAAWLPAESFNVQENWSQPISNFKLGEPITRKITMRATGIMAELLPNVWGNVQAGGITSYADQPELNNSFVQEGAVSSRVESAAVVITQPGEWELPAIRIPWWNTRTDSLEYAEIPAQMIATVDAPAPVNQPSSANTSAPSTQTAPALSPEDEDTLKSLQSELQKWKVLSTLFFLSTLGALGFAWWSRKHLPTRATNETESTDSYEKNEKRAFNALERACLNQHPLPIRESLLVWARIFFGPHINTIDTLVKHASADSSTSNNSTSNNSTSNNATSSEDLRQRLAELDASLFGNKQIEIDGGALASLLQQLRQSKSTKKQNNELEPLYPAA